MSLRACLAFGLYRLFPSRVLAKSQDSEEPLSVKEVSALASKSCIKYFRYLLADHTDCPRKRKKVAGIDGDICILNAHCYRSLSYFELN